MTLTHGTDAERLREVASRLDDEAARVARVHADGTTRLGLLTAAWQGSDLDDFRQEWRLAERALGDCTTRLTTVARALRAQADEQVAVALDAARAGEAHALEAAEQAAAERDEAVASRDRALGELEGMRVELEQLRGQLDETRQDAAVARAKAEESDRARVRAEATSDTLREVLDSLRETTRGAGEPGQS